jgi:hypothetical protein
MGFRGRSRRWGWTVSNLHVGEVVERKPLYDRILSRWLCAVRYFVGLSWGIVEECPCIQRHIEMQMIRGGVAGYKRGIRGCLENWWYMSSQTVVRDVNAVVERLDAMLMFRLIGRSSHRL